MSLPPARSEDKIRQEYMSACAQAGEIQYNISKLEEALEDTNVKIFELNGEFAALAAAKQAPVAQPEVKNEPAPELPTFPS